MKLRLAILSVGAALCAFTTPVWAQDTNVEGRVKKLEKEMQAVQRQVFPNGAGKFFEPDIKTETAKPPVNNGAATSAVGDLISRVDALESQLASLTGQAEQQSNSMRLMEQRLKAVEAGLKKQQADLAAVSANGTTNTLAETPVKPAVLPPVTVPPKAPVPKAPTPKALVPKAPATASTARIKAVAAIERPSSGDAFEDSYSYGYRLWEAKFYPEAQTHLTETVKKFPKHPRASYARNLLGRTWLDDKKPASAVKILYDNYKDDPRRDRAPASLYFLGVALTDL
ncbi:MAG: tetratricopeptide repeat protein, partial [Sphingorhabdus sp.]|nr:tetratricopeptide repeat protein [Sphingorhabdus sp.]